MACNFQLNKRGYKPNGSSCPVDEPMRYSIIKVNEEVISGRGFMYLALKGDNTPTQYDDV